MGLRGIKPEVIKQGKPKIMVSGRSGVGKTFFALEFPSVYYIDVEGGATREQYRKKLIANGGEYLGKDQGSQDFPTVIEELKTLATTKHRFKTVVLDSYSQIYNIAAAQAEEKVGNDFGKDKKEANKPTRQLLRWVDTMDLNVILVCHPKPLYKQKGNSSERVYAGETFDGYDKLEFLLDLWIEIKKEGSQRSFTIKKTRIEAFPDGMEFPLDYKKFSELYGKDVIEKEHVPVTMATQEQIDQILHLVTVVNVESGKIDAFLKKNNADEYADLQKDKAQELIDALKKKIEGVKPNV
jgi:hypothetical protein